MMMRERWVLLDVYDDDDVYYYIRWRLKLEGETEGGFKVGFERRWVLLREREGLGLGEGGFY